MKTEEQIKAWLKETEEDERLHYKSATVFENAPLALIQVVLETRSDVLRTILELPLCKRDEESGKWVPMDASK